MNALIWTVVIVMLVLLGVFRPRWLLMILLVCLYLSVIGVVAMMALILFGKFFGGGHKK